MCVFRCSGAGNRPRFVYLRSYYRDLPVLTIEKNVYIYSPIRPSSRAKLTTGHSANWRMQDEEAGGLRFRLADECLDFMRVFFPVCLHPARDIHRVNAPCFPYRFTHIFRG